MGVILSYGHNISEVLSGLDGGHFATAISDWNLHEWDEHSRAIIAAGLKQMQTRRSDPDFTKLPCDILHHGPGVVTCPWLPETPAPTATPTASPTTVQ